VRRQSASRRGDRGAAAAHGGSATPEDTSCLRRLPPRKPEARAGWLSASSPRPSQWASWTIHHRRCVAGDAARPRLAPQGLSWVFNARSPPLAQASNGRGCGRRRPSARPPRPTSRRTPPHAPVGVGDRMPPPAGLLRHRLRRTAAGQPGARPHGEPEGIPHSPEPGVRAQQTKEVFEMAASRLIEDESGTCTARSRPRHNGCCARDLSQAPLTVPDLRLTYLSSGTLLPLR
jgi:hypothetical protein